MALLTLLERAGRADTRWVDDAAFTAVEMFIRHGNPERLEQGQVGALNQLLQTHAQSREARLYVLSHIIGRNVESSKDTQLREWSLIRDAAYPGWREADEWPDPAPSFVGWLRKLAGVEDDLVSFAEAELGGEVKGR